MDDGWICHICGKSTTKEDVNYSVSMYDYAISEHIMYDGVCYDCYKRIYDFIEHMK